MASSSNNSCRPIAVVTGAASGIGRATAELLAERGCKVVAVDLDLHAVTRVAQAIGGVPYEVDVSQPASIRALAERTEDEIGPVEMVVANAGVIQSSPARPDDIEMANWDAIMAVDVKGVFLTCREFARAMIPRRKGAIVVVASIAGMRSTPLHAYAPAKAAVIHLTTTLAAEWGRAGIRVNAVSPGYVLTPALQRAIDQGLRDVSALERDSALGRMVQARDVAQVIDFLLSQKAGAITGVNLPVDNGWLAAQSWQTYGGAREPQ